MKAPVVFSALTVAATLALLWTTLAPAQARKLSFGSLLNRRADSKAEPPAAEEKGTTIVQASSQAADAKDDRESGRGEPRAFPVADRVQPALEVIQQAPTATPDGQSANVTITVINRGVSPVDEVTLTTTLEPGAEVMRTAPASDADGSLKWSLGRLTPGQSRTVQFQARPPAGRPALRCATRARFDAIVGNAPSARLDRLVLDVVGPEKVAVNEPARFLLTLSNHGDAPVTNVMLQDNLPDGLTHPHGPELENDIGTLAPGENRRIGLSLTPTKAGKFTHRIRVVADDQDPIEREASLQVGGEAIELVVQGPKERYVHRPCAITMTVVNKSDAPARRAEVTATLPKGIEFRSASDGGAADGQGRVVAWRLGDLAPGAKKTLVLEGIAERTGDQIVQVSFQADDGVREEATHATTVRGVASLKIDLVDVQDPIEIGAETTYEIRIVNDGSLEVRDAQLIVDLPSEVEFVDAKGPPESPRFQGEGSIVFEPVARLASKADVVYRVRVKGAAPGEARLKASVRAAEPARPIEVEETTVIYPDQ